MRPHTRRWTPPQQRTTPRKRDPCWLYRDTIKSETIELGEALTVYNLDHAVPEDLRERLEDDERIIGTRYIALDGTE